MYCPNDALVDLQQRFTVIGPLDQIDKVFMWHVYTLCGMDLVIVPMEKRIRCMIILSTDNRIMGLYITVVCTIQHNVKMIIFNQHVEYLEKKMNVTLCNIVT